MREKLSTLPLSELKELAKAKGLKGISTLRKAELIEVLCRAEGETKPAEAALASQTEKKAVKSEKAEKIEETEAAKPVEREANAEQSEKSERAGRTDLPEKSERAGRTDLPEKSERAGRAELAEQPERAKKADLTEKTEHSEQIERAEKGEPSENSDRAEKSESLQKPERPENSDRAGAIREPEGKRTGMTVRRENLSNRREGSRDNFGMRQDRSRTDGRNVRVTGRYDNRNGGYQNRGRNQDNGGRRDYNRSQDNGGRSQDYSRMTGNGSRSQDYSRSQDNGGRSQDYGRSQDNGGRSQDYGRNSDYSRNPDNGNQGQDAAAFNADNGGRSQDNGGRSQDNGGRSQDYSRSQDNGGRNQDYSRSQDNGGRGQDTGRSQDAGAANSENVSRFADKPGYQSDSSFRNTEAPVREAARPDGRNIEMSQDEIQELDSGMEANGILEVMPDGFGFIRCENFLPGENDVYVAPSQIRRFNMKTGDVIRGNRRVKAATEKFAALLYVTSINGYPANVAERRPNFEDLTPVFPNQRIHMETPGVRNSTAMRILDLMAPIGKGQRGMIVSPPKAGKTTLLKQVAKAITTNQPNMHLIILLIDERPEEVTDIKEAIVGENVEVIYSTFDELPERHKRVSEMVIERARRLVEHGRDVTILLDSITRLARAYNLVVPPSGRTLSGGLDPAALHMPKRFFGAARNMREGGSLTILATALIDTGSRMDDVIYEEFKGTGNMELVLDRKLSEKRIFPAIDILKSGTRRDDLLLSREEAEAMEIVRRATNSMKPEESVEKIVDLFSKTRSNREFVDEIRRRRYV